jgi:hypothetical protein
MIDKQKTPPNFRKRGKEKRLSETTRTLDDLLLSNVDDVDLERVELKPISKKMTNINIITYAQALQKILGLSINFELTGLGLRNIQSRNFRNVLILALTLFLLEFEGDTANRASLNTLHQVCGVASNL